MASYQDGVPLVGQDLFLANAVANWCFRLVIFSRGNCLVTMVTKCLQQSQSCHLISSMFLGKAKYRALIQNVILWSFSSPCWHLQVLSRLFLSASVSVSPLVYLWSLAVVCSLGFPPMALCTWGNPQPVIDDLISIEEIHLVFPCVQMFTESPPWSVLSLPELNRVACSLFLFHFVRSTFLVTTINKHTELWFLWVLLSSQLQCLWQFFSLLFFQWGKMRLKMT